MSTIEEDIKDRITREGPITFADFMESALYAPGKGYYATSQTRIGKEGDYFTSPHLHPMFGAMIGKQVLQMWDLAGRDQEFTVVEMGAGKGFLRQDMVSYMNDVEPGRTDRLRYLAIDINPYRRPHPPGGNGHAPAGDWVVSDARDLPSGITGCFLSNELVDAFPVHMISNEEGNLQEIYVGLKDDQFVEVPVPLSTPRISEYLAMVRATLPKDCRAEVNLRAVDWIESVAKSLKLGFVLTIDYGDIASRLFSTIRPAGTLMCYHAHTAHSNPYINVGQQDMTAYVDFTALMLAGQQAGLELTGLTNQAFFLASLGLSEYVAGLTPEKVGPRAYANARMAMHELINPDGLGRFKVLIQHKGLETPQLEGLRFTL